jgi:Holliday junction resolvase RusA-like endonuclease
MKMRSDAIEIESKGYKSGLNPMFGEWSKTFTLSPITRDAPNEARKEFRNALLGQLESAFLFSGEVSLSMTLYLMEHKVLEEAKYGDLDNHMKPILDALKGPEGLLIDDSQVQHMQASWIDVSGEEFFELKIKASPDDFVMKPVALYEMHNRLFYPISSQMWTAEGIMQVPEEVAAYQLKTLETITKERKRRRHELVQGGATKIDAFEQTRELAPVQMGFHKTKVVESGFQLIELKEWQRRIT